MRESISRFIIISSILLVATASTSSAESPCTKWISFDRTYTYQPGDFWCWKYTDSYGPYYYGLQLTQIGGNLADKIKVSYWSKDSLWPPLSRGSYAGAGNPNLVKISYTDTRRKENLFYVEQFKRPPSQPNAVCMIISDYRKFGTLVSASKPPSAIIRAQEKHTLACPIPLRIYQETYEQTELREKFGQIKDGRLVNENSVLVSMKFLGEDIRVNRKIKSALEGVEKNLLEAGISNGFLTQPIESFYVKHNSNNASEWSSHSFGLALDINPKANPKRERSSGGACPEYDLPCPLVEAFKNHGFCWGGHFPICDPMHFEYCKR